jgi:hypothetical protein
MTHNGQQRPAAVHQQSVSRIITARGRVVSGGDDGKVIVWDAQGNPRSVIDIGAPVTDLCVLSDDALAVCSPHGVVTLTLRWD